MSKKQKRNFKTPLHLACSSDELRPVLGFVFFENGYAYATNGYIGIKQSLEYCDVVNCQELNNHAIHRSAFAKIIKYPMAVATKEGIECSDRNIKVLFRYTDMELIRPNLEKCVKDLKSESVYSLALYPHLFALAEKTLYHNGTLPAVVEFNGKYKAMRVTYKDIPNQEAYIMPSAKD